MSSIGKLDQRVVLQSKSNADDGAGGSVPTWATIATVWARVKPMTGREREVAMRNEAHSNYVITIRRRDVSALNRISWQGRLLNVRFVKDAGPRAMYLEIEAEMGAVS